MHVKFAGVKLTLAIPLKDFICTGIMRKHARTEVESGEDLLRDFLCEDPGFYGDDEELSQAFAGALRKATGGKVRSVQMEAGDIAFIRRHFLGWRLLRQESDVA